MTHPRKQQLLTLPKETLIDALLSIADYSLEVHALIERLVSTPEDNLERFSTQLAQIKGSSEYISWQEAYDYANQLAMMLQYLDPRAVQPLKGMQLVSEFYNADSSILNRTDDDAGSINNVFRDEAKDLFWEFAARCDDKDQVADFLLALTKADEYNTRDTLMDKAAESLPEPILRSLITALQKRAERNSDEYRCSEQLKLAESLARQLKDAPLFEQLRNDRSNGSSPSSLIDIAKVYFESGDVDTALARLNDIHDNEEQSTSQKQHLLLEIYRAQNDTEKLGELLYQRFKSSFTIDNLQTLLDVIGSEKRSVIIDEAVRDIIQNTSLKISDAKFMVDVGKIDDAEQYLLKRANFIDGDLYSSFLPLAKSMEGDGRKWSFLAQYNKNAN